MLQIDSIVQGGIPSYAAVLTLIISIILLLIWLDRKLPGFPLVPTNLGVDWNQSSFRRWVSSKRYLLNGRAILTKAYVSGKTYIVPTPKNYYVFISSEQTIKQFASSPKFSLHSAYDDIFAYRYNKLWWDEGEDLHATQVFFFRILREGLTSRLSVLYPFACDTIASGFANHLKEKPAINGWKSIEHYPVIANITVSVIGPIFFGQKLWDNPEFQVAARNFPAQYFAFGEMAQHVPSWSVPLLKAVVTRGSRYRNILIKHLLPIVCEYMNDLESSPKPEKDQPYAVFAAQGKSYWTSKRLILCLESLWRAAGHSVPITLAHAVNAFCEHPEYIESLREEIGRQTSMNYDVLEGLPLLNSFLKETIRTHPIDSVSTRRKALQPFTFSDGGPHVPAGNVVCVPSYNIMNDRAYYPKPDIFDGFRFATGGPQSVDSVDSAATQVSKVADVGASFPFWGYGKEACPGRFFASFEMKAVVAHLLTTYDFKLANKNARKTWVWRSFSLPRKGAKLLIRDRANVAH